MFNLGEQNRKRAPRIGASETRGAKGRRASLAKPRSTATYFGFRSPGLSDLMNATSAFNSSSLTFSLS